MSKPLVFVSIILVTLAGCSSGGGSTPTPDPVTPDPDVPQLGQISLTSVQMDGTLDESATVTWSTDNWTTTEADADGSANTAFSTGAITLTDPGAGATSAEVVMLLNAEDSLGNPRTAEIGVTINP